ncbi:MAG: hypothetical protein ABI243_09720 [Lapillicoccus sp.]
MATIAGIRAQGLRRTLADSRLGVLVWLGGVLGLTLALLTVTLGIVRPELVPLLLLVWGAGWVMGPALVGTGHDAADPRFFVLLPVRPPQLLAGLGVASFVGVGPVVTAVALLSLVAVAARSGVLPVLVAVVAVGLQLVTFVALGRLCSAVCRRVLRRRTGAVVAGALYGGVLAFGASGWAPLIAVFHGDATSSLLLLARRSPAGWGDVSVGAAAGGHWSTAVFALLGLLATGGTCAGLWAVLVLHQPSAGPLTVAARRPLRARTAFGAALGKEARTWTRDLLRTFRLSFALAYAVAYCALPLTIGWSFLLPWAGPIFVVMAAATSANAIGSDGTALWLPMTVPDGLRLETRSRQVLFVAVTTPLAGGLGVLGQLLSGGAAPMAALTAATIALIGGGAGVSALCSVVGLSPGQDTHRGSGNPLDGGGDSGQVGWVFVSLLATAATAVPAVAVALVWGWWGVVVAAVTAGASAWWLGAFAGRLLERRASGLLTLLRTGARPTGPSRAGGVGRSLDLSALSSVRRLAVGLGSGLGVMVIVAQGVVPMLLKAQGSPVRSWFLGLYFPDPWSWSVLVAMTLLGLAMLGYAASTLLRVWRSSATQEER